MSSGFPASVLWVCAQQELPRKACRSGFSEGKQQRQGDSTHFDRRTFPSNAHRMWRCVFCPAPDLELALSKLLCLQVTRDHTRQACSTRSRPSTSTSVSPTSLPLPRPVLDLELYKPDPTSPTPNGQSFAVPCSTPPCLSSEKQTLSSSLTQTRSASRRKGAMATSALPRSPWPLPQPPLHLRPLRPSRPRPRAEIASPSVR